ncbi:T3SS effector HopA1 family protein [Streptomyces erythrochromogenes]|uniref:T3SS effector HopA1 family protein n=1 Tax=Streptomyces erythrochromogenes TaxID=285574 RepID=UPI0036BED5E5
MGDLPGTAPATSVFTRRLAPGTAMAWEPADDRPGHMHLSFGHHRADSLADALIGHADNQDAQSLDTRVHQALIHAGADPRAPEINTPRNRNTPDDPHTPRRMPRTARLAFPPQPTQTITMKDDCDERSGPFRRIRRPCQCRGARC